MNRLDELAAILEKGVGATYFIGKYYFTVNTHKSRADYNLLPNQEIGIEIQRLMQRENEVVLFHEYIHFVHEISTVLGNLCLGLDIALKSTFSHFFSQNLGSSDHEGMDIKSDLFKTFTSIHITKDTLNGSVKTNSRILKVNDIRITPTVLNIPHGTSTAPFNSEIPWVSVESHEDGIFKTEDLLFGRFFLYEGLAYELDREFQRHRLGLSKISDDKKGTEYTFLRLVANFIYPGVSRYAFLTLASLSLSYLDSGSVFINMVENLKEAVRKGSTESQFLHVERGKVQHMLFDKLADFNEAQDEIINVFHKRPRLKKAFAAICNQAKDAYMLRAELPAFEVDMIFSGNYQKLLELVSVCDYMYRFTDDDEFNRDFLGTANPDEESAQATKVLIAYDHYQKSHGFYATNEIEHQGEYCCPFYTSCNLQLRQVNSEVCRRKPWRIFEISYTADRQFCWYGQAVAEFKGHTEP